MKLSPLNILFLILLLNHSSVIAKSLKKLLVKHEDDDFCTRLTNSTLKADVIDHFMHSSLKEKIFFLFFLNRDDNTNEVRHFAQEVNSLFEDILGINFYCKREDKLNANRTHFLNRNSTHLNNSVEMYILRNNTILDSKMVKYVSQSYLSYLIEKFKLKTQMESKGTNNTLYRNFNDKYLNNANKKSFVEMSSSIEMLEEREIDGLSYRSSVSNLILAQTERIHSLDNRGVFILAEQTRSRLVRFLFALILVLVFSFSCFFFIKFSIDWATASKAELNKMKDARLREITEEINNRFAYTKTEF